jgi:hypothetical protein
MAEVIPHLTRTLGPPKEFLLSVQGGRDIYAPGWLVGHGHVEAPAGGDTVRTLDVEIRLTPEGNFVLTRTSRSSHREGGAAGSTGAVRSTPALAYEWLLEDGRGKLGPASKAAWVQACRAVPPMNGLEYERIG